MKNLHHICIQNCSHFVILLLYIKPCKCHLCNFQKQFLYCHLFVFSVFQISAYFLYCDQFLWCQFWAHFYDIWAQQCIHILFHYILTLPRDHFAVFCFINGFGFSHLARMLVLAIKFLCCSFFAKYMAILRLHSCICTPSNLKCFAHSFRYICQISVRCSVIQTLLDSEESITTLEPTYLKVCDWVMDWLTD